MTFQKYLPTNLLGLLVGLWIVLFGAIAIAQTPTSNANYETWDATASLVEDTLANSQPSEVFLTQLRVQLTERRQQFQDAQNTNANRIKTLVEQIAALGAVPGEGETEAPEIAARRQALQEQVEVLSVPRLRATEAFQRANGLIDEIDRTLSARKTEFLLRLGPTPADIRIWPDAVGEIWDSVVASFDGVRRAINTPVVRNAAKDRAPIVLMLATLAILLITQGRKWSERAANALSARENSASFGLSSFVVSLGQVGLPLLGLMVLGFAWQNLGFFGPRFALILADFPWIALMIFGSRWLATRIFPRNELAETPIYVDVAVRKPARRMVYILGLLLALGHVLGILSAFDGFSDQAVAVLTLILIGLAAFPFLRLGQLLSTHGREGAGTSDATMGILIRRVGQLMMLVSITSLILAIIGYTGAANTLMFPAIISAALLATLCVFFEAVRDLCALFSADSAAGHDGLLAVSVNAVLIFCSLPIFALIGGARWSDLTELWTQFKSGVRLGDVQISPGAFFALIVVFLIGYFITRLIQRTLRNRILPKTKMDQGSRNALVSGFGYFGIFIAALIAITSAGIDLSSLAIVAGALSVGIGFGLQNIVSNFVSGIILLIERPISEGDWIEVGSNMGIVKNISVRSTRIETFDRSDVIVPNADLVSGTVTNYTRGNAVGRIILSVGVAYGNDTRKVQELLQPIIENHPMVMLDPPPAVLFKGFGADSLDFEMRALLRDINYGLGVKSELNHQIAEVLTANGIEIPFMQRDIWIRNPEALSNSS